MLPGKVDYEVPEKRFPIINRESKFYHLDRHGAECIYYRIFRSDESSRWIKTFSEMVKMFDRLDLEELYNLVMQRCESTTPEGVDLVLWGRFKDNNCGVHTLTLEDDESASESAYNLLRFIQKQIDKYRSYDGKLASPEQTATGKDFSNPLMANSLPKTIWVLALETSKDAQAAKILKLKDQIKKLKERGEVKPSILTPQEGEKMPNLNRTLDTFDDLDAEGKDYMETKDVVKEGRQSNETEELNKGSGDKGGSTEELVSTAVPKTVSTARPDVDAARQEDSVVEPRTPPTTTSIFDDEYITMAPNFV
ncbi:hypothetical protein Tco_0332195 [Tanacetum coccineum]